MAGSEDTFRARLLETFREEADEYLDSITEGLIELEKTGPTSELIESVYRKTHSLKGAARAVNLREIESICQNLETVFARMKRGEYIPGADDFDLFFRTLAVVKALLLGERPLVPPGEIVKALRALPLEKEGVGGQIQPSRRVAFPAMNRSRRERSAARSGLRPRNSTGSSPEPTTSSRHGSLLRSGYGNSRRWCPVSLSGSGTTPKRSTTCT
jgi:chemotaxis protein histidine kinase CheA